MRILIILLSLIALSCSSQKSRITNFASEYFKVTSAMFKGEISEEQYRVKLHSMDTNHLPEELADDFRKLRDSSYSLSNYLSSGKFATSYILSTLLSATSPILGGIALAPPIMEVFRSYKKCFYNFANNLKRYGIEQEWIDSSLRKYGL